MTPKEKAKELVDKFYSKYNNVRKDKSFSQEQKRMALIAVDEIIKYSPNKPIEEYDPIQYFKDVKQEIEKL